MSPSYCAQTALLWLYGSDMLLEPLLVGRCQSKNWQVAGCKEEGKAGGHLSAFATGVGGRRQFSRQARTRAVTRYFGPSTIFEMHLSVSLGRAREQSLTPWSLGAVQRVPDLLAFQQPLGLLTPGHLGTRAKQSQAVLQKLTYYPKAAPPASNLAPLLGQTVAGYIGHTPFLPLPPPPL